MVYTTWDVHVTSENNLSSRSTLLYKQETGCYKFEKLFLFLLFSLKYFHT